MIYDTARADQAGCAGGVLPLRHGYSFFTLPFLNMTVASDPRSAWQVRTKGKTLKALHGDGVAYFGDHVDMTKDDFASTVGIGGVVGTKFTWPVGSAQRKRRDLTPGRELNFEKWMQLYKEKMLSRGEYLGDCTISVSIGRKPTPSARAPTCITLSSRRNGTAGSRCEASPPGPIASRITKAAKI